MVRDIIWNIVCSTYLLPNCPECFLNPSSSLSVSILVYLLTRIQGEIEPTADDPESLRAHLILVGRVRAILQLFTTTL